MRWPREPWLAAVCASDRLRPMERLVALAYWHGADNTDVVRIDKETLCRSTGASRSAVTTALDGLTDAGWLIATSRPKRGLTTAYRLVIPTTQMSGSRTSADDGDVRLPDISGGGDVRLPDTDDQDEDISGAGVVRLSDTDDRLPGISPPAPSSLQTPPPTEPSEEPWQVVVAGLPKPLGLSLTRTTRLDDTCRRLAADGWSPHRLAAAIAARSWGGAQHGGAVVSWLSGLGQPPPAAATTSPRGRCGQHGHEYVDLDAAGGCVQCRLESRMRDAS